MDNNMNKPSIRFKGYTDAWEQERLGDIVLYNSSNLTAKDAKDDGLYDLYDANEVIGKISENVFSFEYISVIKDGAGVGRIRKLPKDTMIIGTMGALQAKNADLDFIFALLSRFELSKSFSGSTIPHIYFKDYGNNEYYIPSENEQKLIGQLFSSLDSLLASRQRELEKLKNIKKALLQKI